ASGCGRAAPMAICMPAATAPMSTGEPPILTVEDIPVQASLRRPYNHTATIAALPDGELLVAWGAGTKELDADTAIHVTRRSTAGAWGDAGILVDTPGRPDANCVLFLDDGGMLHLYWVAVYGKTFCEGRVMETRSADGGRSWSEARLALPALCTMIK